MFPLLWGQPDVLGMRIMVRRGCIVCRCRACRALCSASLRMQAFREFVHLKPHLRKGFFVVPSFYDLMNYRLKTG
jgi:hypothetical protein